LMHIPRRNVEFEHCYDAPPRQCLTIALFTYVFGQRS
jgi:hypothetical protein